MGGISPAQREAIFAFGLHSNIPACCCLYFVDTWWPAVVSGEKGPEVERHAVNVERVIDKLGGELQYVPCPPCLKAGIFRPLHKCHDSCSMLQVYHAEMVAAHG